jgi:O-acetyl-ADP-ribose deacetylase (regulator of RNase III)
MIEHVFGNVLTVTKGVILQGFNCQGRMGAGLAGQTARLYPRVYLDYKNRLDSLIATGVDPLGHIVVTNLSKDLIHVGGFTQTYFGRDPYTRYASPDAITDVFFNTFLLCDFYKIDVINTVRIGTGLGGLEFNDFDSALDNALDNYKEKNPNTSIPLIKIFTPTIKKV